MVAAAGSNGQMETNKNARIALASFEALQDGALRLKSGDL
jgi:hypothetical protein